MTPEQLLNKVRKIQIETHTLAHDLLAGSWHSAFKGQGLEFEEVREFQNGDDIRSVDWNVTARMGRPYIKRFREERELTVMLVVDCSFSTLFGSQNLSKKEFAAEVGAALAFTAIENHDKVGLVLFSDEVQLYLPPRKGSRHVLRVIRDLLTWEPKGKGTDYDKAISFLGGTLPKSAIVFFLSDFLTPLPEKKFAVLSKKHDLIMILTQDRMEKEFSNIGIAHMENLETGETHWIDTRAAAKKYAEERKKAQAALEKLCGRIGADLISLECGKPYLHPLQKFFKTRERVS